MAEAVAVHPSTRNKMARRLADTLLRAGWQYNRAERAWQDIAGGWVQVGSVELPDEAAYPRTRNPYRTRVVDARDCDGYVVRFAHALDAPLPAVGSMVSLGDLGTVECIFSGEFAREEDSAAHFRTTYGSTRPNYTGKVDQP